MWHVELISLTQFSSSLLLFDNFAFSTYMSPKRSSDEEYIKIFCTECIVETEKKVYFQFSDSITTFEKSQNWKNCNT